MLKEELLDFWHCDSYALFHLIFNTTLSPILQVKRLRLQDAQFLAQGPPASKWLNEQQQSPFSKHSFNSSCLAAGAKNWSSESQWAGAKVPPWGARDSSFFLTKLFCCSFMLEYFLVKPENHKKKTPIFFPQHLGGLCVKLELTAAQRRETQMSEAFSRDPSVCYDGSGSGQERRPQVQGCRLLTKSTGTGIRLSGFEFSLHHLNAGVSHLTSREFSFLARKVG